MSAHCDQCGTDLVHGHGEDWQLMTCPVCTLRERAEQAEEALRQIEMLYRWREPEDMPMLPFRMKEVALHYFAPDADARRSR